MNRGHWCWCGRSVGAVVAALLVALGSAACGADPATDGSERPPIVVTTGIWADVVEQVACDSSTGSAADLAVLIPDGADAHGFEPSLADRARLDDAALVVANGLLLEEGLLDALDAVEADGVPIFRFGDHVDTLDYRVTGIGEDDNGDDEHGDEESADDGGGDGHDHEGAVDPHIWFDPTRVAQALPALADALVDHAGLDRAEVDACVEAFGAELAALDAEVVDLVAGIPAESRVLVTNHEALGYFADRYDFEVLATVSPSPSGLAETNPARLEELVAAMEEAGVGVVFADAQSATDDAEALARSVDGGEVVVLATGALGQPGEGIDTYVDLVRSVATTVVAALAP